MKDLVDNPQNQFNKLFEISYFNLYYVSRDKMAYMILEVQYN